jgi:hypothetical protein
MDDSVEAILSAHVEQFDPVGFEGLGQGSQGRRRGERSVGSMQVVVPVRLCCLIRFVLVKLGLACGDHPGG